MSNEKVASNNALANKIAIITGANGGLGQSVTNAFLAAGAQVIGVSLKIQDSEFPNPKFKAMEAELSSAEAARGVASAVMEQWTRIDALVHLVGGFAGGKSVMDTPESVLDHMLDMNLRAAFYMFQAVLPHMRSAGRGCILAIASRTAVEPAPKTGAYSASKAALVSLVRTLALENKDRGISANTILPGTMDTPANRKAMPRADFSKWVPPSQVAALLAHLASEEASQITGAAIPVLGRDL